MPSEYGEWVHLIDDDAHIDISQGWVVAQLSSAPEEVTVVVLAISQFIVAKFVQEEIYKTSNTDSFNSSRLPWHRQTLPYPPPMMDNRRPELMKKVFLCFTALIALASLIISIKLQFQAK